MSVPTCSPVDFLLLRGAMKTYSAAGIRIHAYLLLVACAIGCGQAERAGVSYETIGDTLFVHNALPEEPGPPPFGFERDLVIGVAQGEEQYMLPSRGSLAAGAGGQIFYFDTMDRTVRVFGPDGTCLRSFGREGQGPGEFSPRAGGVMHPLPGGGLAVEDWPPGLQVFDAEGGLDRVITFGQMDLAIQRTGQIESPYYWLSDKGLYIVQWNVWAMNEDTTNRFLIIEEGSSALQWLPAVSVPPASFWESPGTGVSLPYSSRNYCALTGGHILVWGTTSTLRLTMYDLDSEEWRIATLNRLPDPVTGADIDRYLEDYPEERRDRFRGRLRNAPLPEYKPIYNSIMGDESGRVWVMLRMEEPWLQHEEGYRYDLFDAEGHWLGMVVSPRYLETVRGEYAYTFGWEEYPTIERYRLRLP